MYLYLPGESAIGGRNSDPPNPSAQAASKMPTIQESLHLANEKTSVLDITVEKIICL